MKYVVDILKQFTIEQRFAVLIFIMIVSSLTYIITIYIKSDSKGCSEVVELNKKYVRDFVTISNMIREDRMKGLRMTTDVDSLPAAAAPEEVSAEEDTTIIQIPELNVMDSILSITNSNIEK